MKLHAVRIGTAHFGDLLPFLNRGLLGDQNLIVVAVGGQERVVVFDDDKIPVPTQGSNVDHFSVVGSDHSITTFATNVDALVALVIETVDERAACWPGQRDCAVA